MKFNFAFKRLIYSWLFSTHTFLRNLFPRHFLSKLVGISMSALHIPVLLTYTGTSYIYWYFLHIVVLLTYTGTSYIATLISFCLLNKTRQTLPWCISSLTISVSDQSVFLSTLLQRKQSHFPAWYCLTLIWKQP
jgi:hypothetical protein